MRRKYCIASVLLLCVALEFCACGKKKTEEINIGYSRLRISLPVFVAQEKGFFRKHGLNVKLEMFDTAQPLMDALCSGHIDIAGYTALPITFNAQFRSGKDLLYTTLMMEDAAHPISMFVVARNKTIRSLSELRGKKIGILPTFAYRAWLELILKKNGIPLNEVEIQQVAPAMTPTALASGTVDVMFTNDPAVTTSVQKGAGTLLTEDAVIPGYMWSPFPFASFNITREYASAHPKNTRAIVDALNDAISFIAENQGEARKIMAAFLPEAQKPFVEHYPDALFTPSKFVTTGQLQKVKQAYLNQKILKGDLNLSTALFQ